MGKVEDSARAPVGGLLPSGPEASATETNPAESLLTTITIEFRLAAPRPDRVEIACSRLRELLAVPPLASDLRLLSRLTPLLRERVGAVAAPLFTLLEEAAASCGAPWTLLEGMIGARDRELAHRAVQIAARLAESGSLHVTRRVVELLAVKVEEEDGCLRETEPLAGIERIARRLDAASGETADAIGSLYLHARGRLRRLAARLLDREGRLPSGELACGLVGEEAYAVLGPYLDYTRTTHLDLLSLVSANGSTAPIVKDVARAEGQVGADLLRQVIAELGWPRLNLGLDFRRVIGVSVGGSLPFTVAPWEAPVLESLPGARRTFEACLFVAHGGEEAEDSRDSEGDGRVDRFRSYNLLHSQVLAEILDIAPLVSGKVRRILQRMDAIVEHFSALFAPFTDEAGVLKSVYGDLRERILSELEKQTSPLSLSAELTRLVQAFEDPRSLGEVRTLHGLKRYLHQRGLHLAFRLVEAGRSTNRTVDLVVTSPKRLLGRGKRIRYVDFEPSPRVEGETPGIPHPVARVAEEFGRQLLHGQERFPEVRVFCYGNEVHYYLAFGNHPAFLRIDYASPLQGGMIDLEYYGVSKYELSLHPNPSLEVVCRFLRDLEFDAVAENTRVHARYDKERTLDLGDLCGKAESLFRLVPYLMDLDWIIGALDLDAEARGKVAEAWSGMFARWGVLPVRQLLTGDRRGILSSVEEGPAGAREIPWSGKGDYRDRFAPVPRGILAEIAVALARLGLPPAEPFAEESDPGVGQITLELVALRPLREALARGEIEATPDGSRARSGELFQRQDEGVRFAEILDGSDEEIAAAARLARQVAPLERTLRFRTTGSVNGYEVQSSRLALQGDVITLYVLRDGGGMIRLALFAPGETLWRRREDPSGAWTANGSTDASRLALLLRAGGVLAPGVEVAGDSQGDPPRRIRSLFRRASLPSPPPLPGENVVGGLKAAPGSCVGRALFPRPGRRPEDFDGSVLVAPLLRPEDNTFLYHAAGVASTGGGILSHAGLIAVQFRKPALIFPGRWRTEADGSPALLYRTLEYREEVREVRGFRVSSRREARERERQLREGDLIVLDADGGTLRVLGQDPDTLGLHDGFQLLGQLGRRLANTEEEEETLHLRGWRLRARFQLEKLLARLADPALARHAVRELLLGEALSREGSDSGRAQLLSLLLKNPRVTGPVRDCLLHILRELEQRRRLAGENARDRIPASSSPLEVLTLRREVIRLQTTLNEASLCAGASGLEVPSPGPGEGDTEAVETLARVRLAEIRDGLYWSAQVEESSPGGSFPLRHTLRSLDRLDRVLGNSESDLARRARARLVREDDESLRRAEGRRILRKEDGGFELAPLIGWKAANLAEAERLGGSIRVPSWFVVTDGAFQEMLEAPPGATAATGSPGDARTSGAVLLREAIDAVLRRPELDDLQRSAQIREAWERQPLPEELSAEIGEAYSRLAREASAGVEKDEEGSRPLVAVRSSAREEDAEAAARAGEFETFLFVQGEPALLHHLKRAWSGLWTERAIHNRAVMGSAGGSAGGGVIVQRMVMSRVSGVLQTVNVAEREAREMVINAGLGLGEGIVSGAVAADHIVVSKEGDLERGPLRFRYITADKREKIVFNRREGLGTVPVESLYHQRLRPALEYVELCELVRAASRLEAAYGYPLDIEFGIEGSLLWILQVRPVATYLSVLTETLERHPLSRPARSASHWAAKESRR